MYLGNYGLQKTWLDKRLKSPISDEPATSNMLNKVNHCWNLNDSTFTYLLITVKASLLML